MDGDIPPEQAETGTKENAQGAAQTEQAPQKPQTQMRTPAKKLLAFFRKPPLWFFALWAVCAAGLIAGAVWAVTAQIPAPAAASLYFFAALFLGYSVYGAARLLPAAKRAARARLKQNRFTAPLLGDYGFRTAVFAVCSALIDTAYMIVNGVTAVRYRSAWYATMAGYHLALGLVRLSVLLLARRAKRRCPPDALPREKLKIYLICGIAVLGSDLALGGAVTFMVLSPAQTRTGLILAIATAAYTFYKLTLAIVNLVRARRYRDPVVQCFRNLNMIEALVSLLALQITLLAATGGETPLGLNGITGGAVCLAAVAVGILMIASAARRIKKNGEENAGKHTKEHSEEARREG